MRSRALALLAFDAGRKDRQISRFGVVISLGVPYLGRESAAELTRVPDRHQTVCGSPPDAQEAIPGVKAVVSYADCTKTMVPYAAPADLPSAWSANAGGTFASGVSTADRSTPDGCPADRQDPPRSNERSSPSEVQIRLALRGRRVGAGPSSLIRNASAPSRRAPPMDGSTDPTPTRGGDGRPASTPRDSQRRRRAI
jgi:hypothetical protein